MKFSHWILPHPHTHKRAHLISSKAIIIYILLFSCLQLGIKSVHAVHSGVLGISAEVNQSELIHLTNVEREKLGLSDLKEDSRLDKAALEKGKDMFAENYWAHYSPSGKDPWGFIEGAGYQFSYAGENLARNFYTSADVVNAWMHSPDHRANIVNVHYTDIGMAVLNGTLLGEPTILVVQEFGRPAENNFPSATSVPSAAPIGVQNSPQPSATPQIQPSSHPLVNGEVAGQTTNGGKVMVDAYSLTRYFSLGLLFLIAILLLLDMYVLRKRAVVRLSSNNWAHFALIAVAASAIINSISGTIL